jgi:hypothetical protein
MSLHDSVQKDLRALQRRNIDRARGFLPATTRGIPHRTTEVSVPNRTALPVVGPNTPSQSNTGEFYHLLDYTRLDGTDVLA